MKKSANFILLSLSIICTPLFVAGQIITNPDCVDNYTRGIALYNKGVQLLLNPPSDAEGTDGSQVVTDSFKDALPYLVKVDSACPGDTNVLVALAGIYYALREPVKSANCKNKSDSLKSAYRLSELARLRDSCLYYKDTTCAIYYLRRIVAFDSSCTNRAALAKLENKFVCCSEATESFSKEYNCAIAKAEFYYMAGDYSAALHSFEEASSYYPYERYPKDMIKKCKEFMKNKK